MSQNANPDHEVSADPVKHEPIKKAEWETLPFELQVMIIESLEHQDFRNAWFTCRLVSRRFKEATEQAFKTRILTKIEFAVPVSGFDAIKSVGHPIQYFANLKTYVLWIPFSNISQDNTQAIFKHKKPDKSGVVFATPQGGIPVRCLRTRVGGKFLHMDALDRFWMEKTLDRSANRVETEIDKQPCLLHSVLRFGLPKIYTGHKRRTGSRVILKILRLPDGIWTPK